MSQSAQKNPVSSKVNRSQFHMRFQKKTVPGAREFHKSRKLIIFPRNYCRAQNKQLGVQVQLLAKGRVMHGNFQRALLNTDFRLAVKVIADKKDSGLACFGIIIFKQSVCPDIPVQDINVYLRVQRFYF